MKVFLHKETGQYGHYMGRGDFALSDIPQIFPESMDEENFRKYVKSQEGTELKIDDFEIKNVEILIFD